MPWRSARAGTCRPRADGDSARAALGIAQMRGGEHGNGALAARTRRLAAETGEMLVELPADGEHRVERSQRRLRHEGDLATEQGAATIRRHADQVVLLEAQRAARYG